jgi:exosortase
VIGFAAWILTAAVLYGAVLVRLVRQWAADESYSHGFVVAPIALFLVWQQRDRLRRTPPSPSNAGLAVIALSLAVYALGSLGAELFLVRVSLIGVLAGTVLYVFGSQQFRAVRFPLFFLLFMIPLPTILFDRLAVSLQLVASQLGEQLLRVANVPVLRDGNVLTLATITLEVNDACSGIRSMMALLCVATLIGRFSDATPLHRWSIALAAVPIAIALNGVRIAATGLAASRFGPAVASGAIHAAAGWMVFVAALAVLWGLQHVVSSRFGAAARPQLTTA